MSAAIATKATSPSAGTVSNIRLAIGVLSLSAAGLVGLLVSEGYTDRAVVPVPGDVPTIGFGSTVRADGRPVRMGDTTTPVEALQRAQRDVTQFEGGIKQCVRVPLTQGEYDVYVRLAYNIGPDAFCRSTLVRLLNAGQYRQACDQIKRWRFFRGRDCALAGSGCAGLWTRRQSERLSCLEAQPDE